MNDRNIPAGFIPIPEDHSYSDTLCPVYINIEAQQPVIGLRVMKNHCNPVDFLHGGAAMTLFDIAFATALSVELGKFTSTPTISLNFDFMAGAKQGDWLTVKVDAITVKRTIAFLGGTIEGPQGSVCRASGCYKIPDKLDEALGISVEEYYQWRNYRQ